MLLGLARPLYCIIRWRVTGVNYCAEVRARNLEMALERIGGSYYYIFDITLFL